MTDINDPKHIHRAFHFAVVEDDQTEKVKIGETSFLELLLRPLSLFPWCKGQVWGQHHHYTHLTTPWFFAIICAVLKRFLPLWVPLVVYGVMTIFHVGIKELILDRKKNAGNFQQLAVDLTTRVYGDLIGWLWIFS